MADIPAAEVSHRMIAMIVVLATIGGFMFGYDSGVINGTQEGLEKAFGLSSFGTGLTVGAILIGSAVGAFVAGRLADHPIAKAISRPRLFGHVLRCDKPSFGLTKVNLSV